MDNSLILEENLVKIAENAPKVHESGHKVGFEEGKQAEYDAFWDSYQNNGSRSDYIHAFGGVGWSEETFKPKYNMNVSDGYMIFRYNPCNIDLVEYLDKLGITLDFSNCNRTQYGFTGSKFTRVGVIDVQKVKGASIDAMFNDCTQLKTIDLMKVATTTNMNCFSNCTALENITIEGTIAKNTVFQHSTKLTKASIESIINALSSETSGLTVTLSKTAVNNAFGIDIDDSGTWTEEWTTLRDSKSNWTFAYN